MRVLKCIVCFLCYVQMTAQSFTSFPTNNNGEHGFPRHIVEFQNRLFFTAVSPQKNYYSLWSSDGTIANTKEVSSITPETGLLQKNGFVFNGKLYFSGTDTSYKDSVIGYSNFELCSSDGTREGTSLVKEINPGTYGSSPQNFTVHDGQLYFTAIANGRSNYKLFVTDGTEMGTRQISDLLPGGDDNIVNITSYKNKLYFGADSKEFGMEIFVYDGKSINVLLDINPSGDGFPIKKFKRHSLDEEYNSPFVMYKDRLYFGATNGIDGLEIWSTDGKESDTKMMQLNINGDSDPRGFTLFKDQLVFFASNGPTGYEPWITNGFSMRLIKDINPSGGSQSHSLRRHEVAICKGKLCFAANDGTNGVQLWCTDGTLEGTQLYKSSTSVYLNSRPSSFKVLNDILYFRSITDTVGYYLNSFDGDTIIQTDSTKRKDGYVYSLRYAEQLVEYNNCLYYSANYNWLGNHLWAYCPEIEDVKLINSSDGLTICPNPIVSILTIQVSDSSLLKDEFVITTMLGQVVFGPFLLKEEITRVNLSMLSPGMYLIVNKDRTLLKKMILSP